MRRDLMGGSFIVAAGVCACGADPWISVCAGVIFYIFCELFFKDYVRSYWATRFATVEPGFPQEDTVYWRAACRALRRRDPRLARMNFLRISTQGQLHPAGQCVLRLTEWLELLLRVPSEGRDCLRRMALDFDWKPSHAERSRLSAEVENISIGRVRQVVSERADLIDDLVSAGLNTGNIFHKISAEYLTRITGETFQFNEPARWAAWWQQSKANWTGDAGLVALTARLLRLDADLAAHALATKISGPVEEPLLKELTAQVLFLNRMQKAIRERNGGLESFIKHPARMLLVPELTDAVGLLHADSQLLERLGVSGSQLTRRLSVRVALVDFIGRIWQRYPRELNADMPWVLKTLTDKNLGVLRARSCFNTWWPAARESFIRHDRAVGMGWNAFQEKEYPRAEQFFRQALVEQPRELSSRYNLSLCLVHQQAHDEARSILEELTRLEPKESYWWLALGEMLRSGNRSSAAHAAFRRALELGAAAPRVAWHRGVTFGQDQRELDAIQQLNFVIGKNPTVSKLDSLASALESEGLWKLAVHYREEAFRRGLNNNDSDSDDSEDHGNLKDLSE